MPMRDVRCSEPPFPFTAVPGCVPHHCVGAGTRIACWNPPVVRQENTA